MTNCIPLILLGISYMVHCVLGNNDSTVPFKVVRGLATKRYEFSKYHISKQNKHVCVEQHLYILDMLEFI